ncbi:MAG TPA: iron-sulfur cluster assembly protein [Candidatus Thermoplasmatota archaeon]|nr:iron-sulfur cluster assembly protein [Candidatus Thermoplasmatota archaeon]
MASRDEIINALKGVYDPEIPINIVDLGLVYRVEPHENGVVQVDMTLTAMGCPVGPAIMEVVKGTVLTLEGVKDVQVNLTYDPPWSPERATDDGKVMLAAMGIPI